MEAKVAKPARLGQSPAPQDVFRLRQVQCGFSRSVGAPGLKELP
jgi:hypothetical protein